MSLSASFSWLYQGDVVRGEGNAGMVHNHPSGTPLLVGGIECVHGFPHILCVDLHPEPGMDIPEGEIIAVMLSLACREVDAHVCNTMARMDINMEDEFIHVSSPIREGGAHPPAVLQSYHPPSG